jgi:hypothetical protein
MVRTNRHFLAARRNDADRNSHFNDETPLYSAPTEDTFDDIIGGLTHGLNVEPAKSARAGFPSVEDFHPEDAAARSMASKLAPNQKPRIKIRRSRYRRPNHDRWRFPDEQAERDEQNDEHYADSWGPPQSIEAPRRRGRRIYWGISTGILIVASISVAFGFAKPLSDLLPNRMGDIIGELVANLVDRSDMSAEIEVARNSIGSDPKPPRSEKSMATIAVLPVSSIPVAPAAAAPSVPLSEASGGSEMGSEANSLAAAGGQVLDLGATGLQSGTTNGAAGEFATPKSPPAPGEKNEDRLDKPVLQRSVQANPTPITSPPARVDEPVSSKTRPVEFPLSAAQIDRLLARGEELLQSGDIVSARLAFLRVAATGDLRGAMGVGMTYDPDVYARISVTGLTPDREQAEFWYNKAGEVPSLTIIGKNAADTPNLRDAGSPDRNAACARKYKSFDANTGLYTSYSGVKRPCRLP